MAEGLTLDPRPYEAAIKACAVLDAAMPNAVHVEPAWAAQGEAVYRRALTAGVPPGPGLFLAVLRCAAMARDSGMARKILEEWEAMLDAGAGVPRRTRPSRGHRAGVTRPGAAALTYVARALQPDAAAVGAAVTHFKETHGVDPPVPVWNAVLRCHAEADDVDGAFGVLQEMRATGVRPDGGTCRVVAQAFQGNPSLAAELVAEVDAERRSGPAARAWPGRPRALAKPPWSFGPKLVVQRPGVGGAREVGEAGKATDSGNGGVDARADGGQGPAKRAPDVAPATLDAGPAPTDSPAADACPAIADAAPPSPTPVPTPSPTGGVLALELDLHGLSVPAGRAAVLNASRYDVYKLRDALLEGQLSRYARILNGLRGEGEALPLVLWAISDGLRRALAAGAPALRRARLLAALRKAADVDRVAKGLRAPGSSGDAWDDLLALGMLLGR